MEVKKLELSELVSKYARMDTGARKRGQYNSEEIIKQAKKCIELIKTNNSKYPNGFRLPFEKFQQLFKISSNSSRNIVYQLNNAMRKNRIKLHFGMRTVGQNTWIAINPEQ